MPKLQFMYNTNPNEPNTIVTFFHCTKCLEEFKARVPEALGKSPATYARLNFGINKDGGFQVWCVRHDLNVAVITPHLADTPADELPGTSILSWTKP